jgi:hypothetical protein
MRDVASENRDDVRLDTCHIHSLLEETRVAVGYLYQLNPNPASIEPLYSYAIEALDGLASELDGTLPTAYGSRRAYRRPHRRSYYRIAK